LLFVKILVTIAIYLNKLAYLLDKNISFPDLLLLIFDDWPAPRLAGTKIAPVQVSNRKLFAYNI